MSIDFVAFNYKNTLQNKYKYKMEGYDKDWRESGTRHFTTYTNLPPGEYTFRVIASNNDGLWNEKGASVKIKILPAPWVSWWAYMLYIIIACYLIYLFVQYKQKQQKKKLEDDRKNGELAEAKALQERLLPKILPAISNLDIAGYLRTSTEVGAIIMTSLNNPMVHCTPFVVMLPGMAHLQVCWCPLPKQALLVFLN